MALTIDQKKALFRYMLVSREGDLREQRLIRQGKGAFHVSGMGHEAMAALALSMREDDYCFPFYRDRAFAVARGITNYDLALAFFAKRESSSAGKQLPAHYNNRKLNIWSLASPTGEHLLPACGAAWGIKMDGKDSVVMTSAGDSVSRQGDFYEAVSFAKEKKLPMIFIIEDNAVAISMRTEMTNALSLGVLSKEEWLMFDGCDVEQVYGVTHEAVNKIRKGKGPVFIWSKVLRMSSHSSADDHRNYRSEEELEDLEKKDPIRQFREHLIAEGIYTQEEIDELQAVVAQEIKYDYNKASNAEEPKRGEEMLEVVAELQLGDKPPLVPGKEYRLADALNLTFKDILRKNKGVCFFGEDIEDPLGGVFKLTKGLSTEFPEQVANSPVAESTIMGVAAGLAGYGKLPIFEIQFIDFIMTAWNQLVNNIAGLRWRSHGQWKCPAIIYAPCGAYLPGGAIWHSQTNESAFAHFPGMHVVMPSTPVDTSGMLLSALKCEDPVLFLIPKHMLWAKSKTPKHLEPVPLGKAAVRQEGTDVTLLSWGNCLEICEDAMNDIEGSGISIELIDLRTIVPWDKEAVKASVKKTGRLVIVQEDTVNCSVGQMVVTELLADTEFWEGMVAAPLLVSKGNVLIGYNEVYEYSCLPDKERVVQAIRGVMMSWKKSEVALRSGLFKEEIATVGGSEAIEQKEQHRFMNDTSTVTIVLPNLGEGLREARVVGIFKREGESVSEDDALCDVETDKAVFPIECSVKGTVKSWRVKENDLITVGQEMLIVESSGGSLGANGSDSNQTPPLKEEQEHLTDSQGALSPHILKQMDGVLPARLSVTADWDGLRKVWAGLRGRSNGGVFSYTTMVAWCVVQAIKEFPAFRRLLKTGGISDPQDSFDIGFAVALDNDELATAVINNVEGLDWHGFVKAYREVLKEVKEGKHQSKARVPMLLTSMGPLKIRSGSPIVIPPAVGTLFLGEPYFESVFDEGKVEFKEVVMLDLAFDHRWANGAGAGRFLKQVKKNIESFHPKE